ncbi:MAG TPA: hypothetical protein VJC05_01025 [Candidatus Andersenbacteria bacterium]|nr:hypothetical protein [Candidatus Andersenbacteria bacterium]
MLDKRQATKKGTSKMLQFTENEVIEKLGLFMEDLQGRISDFEERVKLVRQELEACGAHIPLAHQASLDALCQGLAALQMTQGMLKRQFPTLFTS